MDAQSTPPVHILVPLDGSLLSEQAIPYAHALLGSGGLITLFRAIPKSTAIQDPTGGTLLTEREVLTRYRVLAGQEVVAVMDRWGGDSRVRSEVAIETGDPAAEILRATHERGAGMIVMASKGRGAFGRLALGSVTDRIARAADVPVVVVRPDDALPDFSLPLIRRLVVPIDGSELSLSALPTAQAIAQQVHASIHVVTIVDFAKGAPPALAYGAAFSQDVYDVVMAEIESHARTMLGEVVAKVAASGIDVTSEVLSGMPAEAIIDVATRGDLIVMTSHGIGGFKRWLLGSVAEKLVRHSPVPLVIVPARTLQTVKSTSGASKVEGALTSEARLPDAAGFMPARW